MSKKWTENLHYAQREWVGARKNQEDFASITLLTLEDEALLTVLADGMGGHEAGEVASQTAVSTFVSSFKSFRVESLTGRLTAALQASNAEISRQVMATPSREGMGCTLVALIFQGPEFRWISVGDSVLYLYRNQRLIRLNADHSMAPVLQEMYQSGRISASELATHPQRNALRSAVTGEELSIIDVSKQPFRVLLDDIIVVASDGLLSISEAEITKLLKQSANGTAASIAADLLDGVRVKNKQNQDNVTIQIIKPPFGASAVTSSRRRLALNLLIGTLLTVAATAAYLYFPLKSQSEPPNQPPREASPRTTEPAALQISPIPAAPPNNAAGSPEPAVKSKPNRSGEKELRYPTPPVGTNLPDRRTKPLPEAVPVQRNVGSSLNRGGAGAGLKDGVDSPPSEKNESQPKAVPKISKPAGTVPHDTSTPSQSSPPSRAVDEKNPPVVQGDREKSKGSLAPITRRDVDTTANDSKPERPGQ